MEARTSPGTSIGLSVVVYDFREGHTPEEIRQSYPSIQSLPKLYGALTYILEHPEAIEQYLAEETALWEQFERDHPIPEDMLRRYYKGLEELERRHRREDSISV